MFRKESTSLRSARRLDWRNASNRGLSQGLYSGDHCLGAATQFVIFRVERRALSTEHLIPKFPGSGLASVCVGQFLAQVGDLLSGKRPFQVSACGTISAAIGTRRLGKRAPDCYKLHRVGAFLKRNISDQKRKFLRKT